MNLNETIQGCLNITTQDQWISYTASTFTSSVAIIFSLFILMMMLLGLIMIRKDKGNFYGIFIFSALIMGIALFFTFIFPIIPQFINKFLEGLI